MSAEGTRMGDPSFPTDGDARWQQQPCFTAAPPDGVGERVNETAGGRREADRRIPGVFVASYLARALCLQGRYGDARTQSEFAIAEARRSRRLHRLAFAVGRSNAVAPIPRLRHGSRSRTRITVKPEDVATCSIAQGPHALVASLRIWQCFRFGR
jgi:hypothetical protein